MNRLPSLWQSTASIPPCPRLQGDLEVDVAVIGGGISGLTAALLLQRAGKKVALIEAHRIGAGETGHTTAHLTELLDARYHVLESKFGKEGALLAADSARASIARIEAFVMESEESCGFRRVPGYLYAETRKQKEDLDREFPSLERVGARVSHSTSSPLPFPILSALRIENQARVHPLEYLRVLSQRARAAGALLFESTRMLDVEEGEPCRVITESGTLRARDVLVLTNVPVSNRFVIHTKIAAYRTYALAARLPQSELRDLDALFEDMDDPYHYIRLQDTSEGTFLIVGGEDHKTGKEEQSEDRVRRLEEYTRRRFPDAQIQYRWSGQVIEPSDGLPYIGRNPHSEHVYIGTGYSGTGMTFGTLAAMIVSDAVLGLPNRWAELYRATRIKPLAQAQRYVSENVDFPMTLAHDRVAHSDVERVEALLPGQGARIRQGRKMLAVYRDDKGVVHARSAVCPHMGCYVRWNSAERSWDCPCHGSRFGVDGEVLNGPAVQALKEEDLEVHAEESLPTTA